MKPSLHLLLSMLALLFLASCVSQKEYAALEQQLSEKSAETGQCQSDLKSQILLLQDCESRQAGLQERLQLREEQIVDLRQQLEKSQNLLDQQLTQVGDLTVLSQSASENINKTLDQMAAKDKYIQMLQQARTKADSINLALALNLKSVLAEGIADEDIEINVDKTVVFVNLSDKMLFKTGSSEITPRASEVLGKVAQIIQSRPDIEVMVEGYTDDEPITSGRDCLTDNWDLSVDRAVSVVRSLEFDYNVDPNKLIAAGRGQYNQLVSNETAEGRAKNRRTRIIIMPKLEQFYELLNPNNVPE